MSEVAIESMDLNGNESQKQGMLHKFAKQNNYESIKKEEDDEYGYQSKEKEMKDKLMLVNMNMEKI